MRFQRRDSRNPSCFSSFFHPHFVSSPTFASSFAISSECSSGSTHRAIYATAKSESFLEPAVHRAISIMNPDQRSAPEGEAIEMESKVPDEETSAVEAEAEAEAVPEPSARASGGQDDESRRQDDLLLGRARGGDVTAFDDLVRKYTMRLYGLVYNMTSNHEDTNDLLQDVWAKAYRSLAGFRGRSAFYTWIHSIAVNMTLNFLQKRARRTHASLDDVDSGLKQDKDYVELAANSTPVRETNLKELQKRLNEALQKLSEQHRAVVVMFDIQDMPHKEISKILGISEGTVRSRLFYAHRQLQNYLSDFQ